MSEPHEHIGGRAPRRGGGGGPPPGRPGPAPPRPPARARRGRAPRAPPTARRPPPRPPRRAPRPGREEFTLSQHPGAELLYMLEGEMVYRHAASSYRMLPGDALQLDGEGVHGPRELITLPIRFLSVVAYGDADLD